MLLIAAIVLAVSGVWGTSAPPHAVAAGPCDTPVNVIACENSLPGDPPSDWQVSGSGDSTIQGFATAMSLTPGQTLTLKVATTAKSYHIDILRLGYYQGNGARRVAAGISPTALQTQPSCLTDSSSGLVDCGNWAPSASWTVPSTAVSGVYLAHLVRNDTGGSSLVPFVVRDDASNSSVLFQTSDETWQAYNTYGGNSLYQCTVACPPGNPGGYKGAYKVSYNRPFHSATDDSGRSWLLYAEYPMIRFMEQNGYDVSYTSGLDVATRGPLLLNHKLFLSVGHDEYWSGSQRANVENARDQGVNLDFFSGNEMFWKTRWEPSLSSDKSANRTLVTYKETHFDAPVDPQDPSTWTGTWRDPRFSPPADARPENSVTGQFFLVNSGTTDIQVPSRYAAARLWRNTAVASLSTGQTLTLGSGLGTLGYEWDEDADNGSRPPGLMDLSSTTAPVEAFVDYGTNVAGSIPTTHHLTLYRAPSGALVFGAGTVQWSWGLDGATTGQAPDRTMQQATVNLFADQGAQPYSLAAGLSNATASTDTTAPSSTIATPADGTTVSDGVKTTVTGTATDSGGGVVTGVEVSTDNGTTWHPASGTSSWSYSWVSHGSPSTTILSRAVDDSGNLESPSAGSQVKVACPCSIFGTGSTPAAVDSADPNGVEIGVRFRSDEPGSVTGIRFYKSTKNTGTHVGNLWTDSGQLLARATFGSETASGWQQVAFSTPVQLAANTTYVVSYYAPVGHYSQDEGYMYGHPAPQPDGGDSLDSPPLHAIRNVNGQVNGLYGYASATAFPTSTYQAENYWVDPVFSPATRTVPAAPTNVKATAADSSATVSWSAPADGGSTITKYTVTPYVGGTPQASTTVSGTPAPTSATVGGLQNGTAYTFTVTATNATGTGPLSVASNAVTPAAPVVPSTPSNVTATAGDSSASVRWTAPSDGGSTITSYTVTPYVGGTAQPPTTVTGSPAATSALVSGLQNGTQYTFTVFATNSVGVSPPSAPSNAVTPTVVTVPAAPGSVAATAGKRSATVTWAAPANGGSPITAYVVTPYVGTQAGTPVTVTGSPPVLKATLSALKAGTTYTFRVVARNSVGTGPPSAPSNQVTPTR